MKKISVHLPPALRKPLRALKPLARHHYFIVTVTLFSSVAIVIYLVNETLHTPSDSTYQSEKLQSTIGNKFNKDTRNTIEKIKSLQKSTDSSGEAPLPSGRINPFAE